jgi:3-methyladenine DNA glycosylase/8-oxoguanine DNA glycosylase
VITACTAISRVNFEEELTRADPELGRVITAVIARIGQQRIMPSRAAPFEALVRAIVYQSASGKAARVISTRLKRLVGETFGPAKILGMSENSIASAGLSKSKSRAILNLAEWSAENRKVAKALSDLPDEEVVATLTGIAGIGAWTANVFLIFNLVRLDVMPASDLGIQRGVQLVYRLKDLATPKQVHEKAQLWRLYRSIASIYLWNAIKLKIAPNDLS